MPAGLSTWRRGGFLACGERGGGNSRRENAVGLVDPFLLPNPRCYISTCKKRTLGRQRTLTARRMDPMRRERGETQRSDFRSMFSWFFSFFTFLYTA